MPFQPLAEPRRPRSVAHREADVTAPGARNHPRVGRERPDRTSAGAARYVVHRRWRAMGSDAHLILVGRPGAPSAERHVLERMADAAVERVAELEARWSRFLPTSEISALNRVGWATVSPETFALIDRAIAAWRATDGRFDPLQLRRLQQLGYDRSFDRIGGKPPSGRLGEPAPRPLPSPRERADGADAPVDSLLMGCAGIVLDPYSLTVILPVGAAGRTCRPATTFDPGGIGKGFAADLVVEELLAAGAGGAMVNLGGDLRVDGTPPAGDGWVIEVLEEAWSNEAVAVLELERGGVATSTPLRRTWMGGVHHLLDPVTGSPADHGPAVATAVAGAAWWAEAAATALAVGRRPGSDATSESGLDPGSVATATVDFDGTVTMAGGFERFARSSHQAAPDVAEPVGSGATGRTGWSR